MRDLIRVDRAHEDRKPDGAPRDGVHRGVDASAARRGGLENIDLVDVAQPAFKPNAPDDRTRARQPAERVALRARESANDGLSSSAVGGGARRARVERRRTERSQSTVMS